MIPITQNSSRNLILQSLPEEDFALLAPHLSRRELEVGSVLATVGKPIDTICFPEAGIITFSDVMSDGSRVGIAHLGFDGFAGWPVLLGCDLAAHDARVTADGGTALHLSPAELLEACRGSETLRTALLRFVQAFTVQLGRTIVSSLTQPVHTRLCRWTLMAHDRAGSDEIKVTHDEIAVMLGIRRASVTDTLHILEGDGLIRCSRGRVVIRDREGLRQRAGETYGYYEAEYSRLIAPFPPPLEQTSARRL